VYKAVFLAGSPIHRHNEKYFDFEYVENTKNSE